MEMRNDLEEMIIKASGEAATQDLAESLQEWFDDDAEEASEADLRAKCRPRPVCPPPERASSPACRAPALRRALWAAESTSWRRPWPSFRPRLWPRSSSGSSNASPGGPTGVTRWARRVGRLGAKTSVLQGEGAPFLCGREEGTDIAKCAVKDNSIHRGARWNRGTGASLHSRAKCAQSHAGCSTLGPNRAPQGRRVRPAPEAAERCPCSLRSHTLLEIQ